MYIIPGGKAVWWKIQGTLFSFARRQIFRKAKNVIVFKKKKERREETRPMQTQSPQYFGGKFVNLSDRVIPASFNNIWNSEIEFLRRRIGCRGGLRSILKNFGAAIIVFIFLFIVRVQKYVRLLGRRAAADNRVGFDELKSYSLYYETRAAHDEFVTAFYANNS